MGRSPSPLLRWLLLAGVLGAGGAAASCAVDPGAEDEDEVFSSEEDVTGTKNKMGLRLVFDETSRRVHATVKRKLRAGESLRLRVRRGRLSMDSQAQLACSELPEAPALPLTEGATKVTYEGPVVEPSLLASVYDEEWILGNITPRMLDELAREGADSIVEACIVKGDTVRARLQTSIEYAWDAADPNANPAVLNRRSASLGLLSVDAGLAAGDDESERPIHSMERYAELCVSELGEIPFFPKRPDGKYGTFDCRALAATGGEAIPGVEGAPIPQGRETVAAATNAEGTHWTLLCRSPASGDARFGDISMIGHDPKSGKTCFFQNKLFDGTDGARIPHPADVEKSRHVWDAPKGYCTRCHSADAFVHSAWIDGARRRDGTPVVPTIGTHPALPPARAFAPYSVVHREAQARGRIGGSSWETPRHLVSEEARPCTACHRIGGGDGLRRFGTSAIPETHSMRGASVADWAAPEYGAAIAHIETCARDPQADGCSWADVPAAR